MNEIKQEKPVNMNKCVRTYSRRRGEDTKIDGVEELCRLCLNKCEGCVPIFADNGDDKCAALALRIMMCVGFEVSNIECLPNKICIDCNKELDRIYNFRKKCELSYQKLKSHMAAIGKIKAKIKQGQDIIEKIEDGSQSMEVISQNTEGDEKNEYNVIFVVESDGTMKFEPSNNKVLSSFQEIPEEAQLKYNPVNNENSLLIQTVDSPTTKDGEQEINTIDDKTTIPTTKQTTIPNNDTFEIEVQSLSETIIEESKSESPDVVSMLSQLLIEAGVLSCHNNHYSVRDEKVELETADSSVVTLKFVEEDDGEPTLMPLQFNLNNNETDKLPDIQHVIPKQKQLDLKGASPGQWWCNSCGRSLGSRSALARHCAAVHARLRPHRCECCQRTFAQKAVMTRHMLVHQEKRPFQCTECAKSFTQRGSLEQHLRSHRKTLALHHCPVCKKVFLYASGLSRHMITHNSPGFGCGGCPRQFNDKSSLKRHMKNTSHPPHPDS